MASYGHLPPPPPPLSSSLPQNPIHHHRNNNNNQYNQNWNYGFPESYNHNNQYHPQHHHYPPPPPPPPPPPESSYIAPPPPPPAAANHYSQHKQQQQQQPPPSRNSPPPPHNEEKGLHDRKSRHVPHRQHKNGDVPPMSAKKSDGRKRKVETEEEIRLRKKREFEKQRQLKKSQNLVLQKTQKKQGRGSVIESKMVERKIAPLLSSERAENRLKKPTTFVCKLKFRNELPDPTAQPKLMAFKKDKDQYTKYKITSLEKMYKPKLFVEPDLGIPLDLLDLSVYNPPSVRQPLAPEDEELLQDDEAVTPLKNDGRKRKERPTDKGVAWLVKTQYISPLSMESTKQSLTEKQAKELREMKGGRDILENLNDSERQIKEIEASFEASKSCPVHATNKDLRPIEVLPLLLDFDRYDDQFVVAAFDNSPTADSEMYAKLDKSDRDALESRAIMKSYVSSSTDTANPEKFLAYMVPAPRERSKDIYDENEDVSYSWVREYHWDVRGDDALGPTTYLVSFDESKARYLPLPTKLVLRKKRAKEGRSGDEVEQFQIPSSVVVRQRSSVAAFESKKSRVYTKTKGSSSKPRGGIEIDNDMEEQHRGALHQDNDQSSGAEDDMSD